ncbi:DUF3624 family protein [Mucilaginibacter gotjawali]|uniref:DUF3624 family protein n=1 Tax=Mucilaginibacter gotjawali TaxID=1550579 RepID=UPI000BBA6646
MACCGQLTNQPFKRKLGKCKTCIFLSFSGTVVSIALLCALLFFPKTPVMVIVFIAILALAFTALSVLHIVFYFKGK